MGYTYTWGDRSIELKDEISVIALSRFSDSATDLWNDITDIYLDREHWQALKDSAEKDVDDDDSASAESAKYQMRQRLKRAEVGFELAGHSVEALQAMIEFCVSVTASVSGFTDDAGDPLVWKHMSDAEKSELYEYHVTSGQMVTIVLDCWAHKTGILKLEDKAE